MLFFARSVLLSPECLHQNRITILQNGTQSACKLACYLANTIGSGLHREIIFDVNIPVLIHNHFCKSKMIIAFIDCFQNLEISVFRDIMYQSKNTNRNIIIVIAADKTYLCGWAILDRKTNDRFGILLIFFYLIPDALFVQRLRNQSCCFVNHHVLLSLYKTLYEKFLKSAYWKSTATPVNC